MLFAGASVAAAVADAGQIEALGRPGHRIVWGGELDGFDNYEHVPATASPQARADQPRGTDFLYSREPPVGPKGIKIPFRTARSTRSPTPNTVVFGGLFQFTADTVYLSPHRCTTLRHCAIAVSPPVGGTVIMLDRFEPEAALAAIDKYRVTHSQWVPVHPDAQAAAEIRERYDVSSIRYAVPRPHRARSRSNAR